MRTRASFGPKGCSPTFGLSAESQLRLVAAAPQLLSLRIAQPGRGQSQHTLTSHQISPVCSVAKRFRGVTKRGSSVTRELTLYRHSVLSEVSTLMLCLCQPNDYNGIRSGMSVYTNAWMLPPSVAALLHNSLNAIGWACAFGSLINPFCLLSTAWVASVRAQNLFAEARRSDSSTGEFSCAGGRPHLSQPPRLLLHTETYRLPLYLGFCRGKQGPTPLTGPLCKRAQTLAPSATGREC